MRTISSLAGFSRFLAIPVLFAGISAGATITHNFTQTISSCNPNCASLALTGLNLTARSLVTNLDTADPFATSLGSAGVLLLGNLGTTFTNRIGLGVQPSNNTGSRGISGDGAHDDELILFSFTGAGAISNTVSFNPRFGS
jgi:hypothetical protein